MNSIAHLSAFDFHHISGLPWWLRGKNPPANARDAKTWVRSLNQEDLLGQEMATPLQYSLPGKFHGQRSLAGYSPWGHKESDTTE